MFRHLCGSDVRWVPDAASVLSVPHPSEKIDRMCEIVSTWLYMCPELVPIIATASGFPLALRRFAEKRRSACQGAPVWRKLMRAMRCLC